jgi:hypothetical protein
VEFAGAKCVKLTIVQQDDRQWDGKMKAADFGYVPFMVVNHMLHDHFTGVELTTAVRRNIFLLVKCTVSRRNQRGVILNGSKHPAGKQKSKNKADGQKTKNRYVRCGGSHETTCDALISAKIENNIESVK